MDPKDINYYIYNKTRYFHSAWSIHSIVISTFSYNMQTSMQRQVIDRRVHSEPENKIGKLYDSSFGYY